jgi:PAS domain S-box-containing protein
MTAFQADALRQPAGDVPNSMTAHALDPPTLPKTAIHPAVTLSELELLQRERAMRLLMEGAGDFAIIRLDPNGLVVHWDEGAEQLVQYTAREVVGRHFGLFYTEGDRLSGLPERALADSVTIGRHNIEHWFVGKGGGFWASNVFMPMTDTNGLLIGFAKIVRNITKRREEDAALTRAKEDAEAAARTADLLSAKVQAANRELQEANDSLQRFTSIVAHDLRAPLRRVETLVQFLMEDYAQTLDADGKDIMSRLNTGVVRIRLMLTSLLDYSKCSRGVTQGKTAQLSRIVDAALMDLDLDMSDVDLIINLQDVDAVSGDAQLLSHVIHNVVGNAIKFRRAGCRPAIKIDAISLDTEQIEVAVTDNGIGIEPQFVERVFDMLYRLHNDDEYEGTGIGLSVCRKIVRDHGGQIWIDPDFADGTRVVFTLSKPTPQEVDNRADGEPDTIIDAPAQRIDSPLPSRGSKSPPIT